MKLADGGHYHDQPSLADRPWLGEGENVLKVVHIDEQMGQVIFLQRFAEHTKQPVHTHHCSAIAYTIKGAWEYEDARFPEGTVVFEPPGSTHYAGTGEGDTAEVLVILTAEPGSDRLLEVVLDDGRTFELDLPMFKAMADMPDNDAWMSHLEKELA